MNRITVLRALVFLALAMMAIAGFGGSEARYIQPVARLHQIAILGTTANSYPIQAE